MRHKGIKSKMWQIWFKVDTMIDLVRILITSLVNSYIRNRKVLNFYVIYVVESEYRHF